LLGIKNIKKNSIKIGTIKNMELFVEKKEFEKLSEFCLKSIGEFNIKAKNNENLFKDIGKRIKTIAEKIFSIPLEYQIKPKVIILNQYLLSLIKSWKNQKKLREVKLHCQKIMRDKQP